MHDLPSVYRSVHRGFCRRFGSRGFFVSPCLAPAAWLAFFNSIPTHLLGVTRQVFRTCGVFSVCRYLASKHVKARKWSDRVKASRRKRSLVHPYIVLLYRDRRHQFSIAIQALPCEPSCFDLGSILRIGSTMIAPSLLLTRSHFLSSPVYLCHQE